MSTMGAPPIADRADTDQRDRVHRAGRPAWVAPAAVGAAGLAGCLLLRAANPTESTSTPLCPFKLITGGVDCPGCGMTRAANALLHGHLGVAADHNLLFVVLLPVAALAYATWALRSVGFRLTAVRPPRGWVPALVVAMIAFWALRLLPWEPFTWLASARA